MYIGHVGVALAARRVRKDLPLWLGVIAAQGCDWVDVWLIDFARDPRHAMLSHSLPAVAIGATLLGLLAWVITRSAGAALAVLPIYASHWVLDLITGTKPTWPGGPEIGLDLYARPGVDFLLEAAVVAVGWWLYRASLPERRRVAPVLLALLIALIAMQGLADAGFALQGAGYHFALAAR